MQWGLIAGVLIGLDSSIAFAQFFPGNNPYFRPTGGVGVGVPAQQIQPQPQVGVPPMIQPIIPGGGNLISNPYANLLPNPYVPPVNPYSPFYFGQTFNGGADVINAQGRYLIDRQDALMKREQVKQMKLETRRKIFDEWLYERERTPRPEELRQQAMREQLSRSLNDPPANEVTSAISLNNILSGIDLLTAGKKVPVIDIPIDEDMLKKVNLSKGVGTGNAGALRNEGKLVWPRGLETLQPIEKTTEIRNKIAARTKEAYQQASSGVVDVEIIKDLQALTAQLNGLLRVNINAMGFNDYTEAKKFVDSIDASITVLARADARDFLEGGNVGKAKNVQDLIRHMNEKGLKFAPVVGNNEGAYLAMHRALVQYYNSLSTEMTKTSP